MPPVSVPAWLPFLLLPPRRRTQHRSAAVVAFRSFLAVQLVPEMLLRQLWRIALPRPSLQQPSLRRDLASFPEEELLLLLLLRRKDLLL